MGRASYKEPLSPSGRHFLDGQWDLEILCFLSFQKPVDVAALKLAVSSSVVICPRLRSVLVAKRRGRLAWEELPEIDVDAHVVADDEEEDEKDDGKEDEVYVNEYVVALASSGPMTRDAPLWRVHVLPRRRRSVVLRFHHALGDCVSLLALLLAGCDPGNEALTFLGDVQKGRRRMTSVVDRTKRQVSSMGRTTKAVWYTIPFAVKYLAHTLLRKKNATLSIGDAIVKPLPTKMSSLTLCLNDMKIVKNVVNAKINDVFVGIVSYGLSKYMDLKSSKETAKDIAIRGVVAVNLRREGSKDLFGLIRMGEDVKWGNRVGYFVLPISLEGQNNNPLSYVKKARSLLDRKKTSFEAQFSYLTNNIASYLFGRKSLESLHGNFRSNSSLFLSNIVGPSHPIAFANNLVTRMGVTLSDLPGTIDVHMISYDGKAFLQILVAEEVIPDPELLCICIQEALQEMKTKAMGSA
ncbi:wax ester synthase/diacylglycerol acyltransferase 2-like [Wolffia australiana]